MRHIRNITINIVFIEKKINARKQFSEETDNGQKNNLLKFNTN